MFEYDPTIVNSYAISYSANLTFFS